MEYLIRPMRPEDAPGASRIEAECIPDGWSTQGFLDALAIKENIFLVCEAGGQIAGYCGMYRAANEGEITNAAVSAPFRRRGIAGALLGELFRLSKEKGVRVIFLEVREGNVPAIRLYEAVGFEMMGKRRGFYKNPHEDALTMKRELA